MPLRVPQQPTVARLIVLPMPQQRTVEANTEAVANTISQQAPTFVVAANKRPEAAERKTSAVFCVCARQVGGEPEFFFLELCSHKRYRTESTRPPQMQQLNPMLQAARTPLRRLVAIP